MEAGAVTLDLSNVATRLAIRHDETENVLGVGPTEVQHAQTFLMWDARLTAELGLSETWAAGVMLPWRTVSTRIRFLDLDDHEVQLAVPSIHHRNETLSGVGDPWLWGRWSRQMGEVRVGARLGLSLPAGRTVDDPFRLTALGREHEHLQFGTGTFNPLLGIEAQWRFASWSLIGSASTLQVLYANQRGYQAGDRYMASLGALSRLGTDTLTLEGAAEASGESAEHWPTSGMFMEGNQGRIDLLASLGGAWRFAGDWYVSATVKLPFYKQARGEQLSYPLLGVLSVGGLFEPAGHEHHHEHEAEHEHGDEHAHMEEAATPPSDIDRLDVASAGEAVDLVPVSGKVTVFDFWAEWCGPCHELDARLSGLARRHPGALAIRRINIVDGESPASQRYLNEQKWDLPHIKVYDREGALVIEKSGEPYALQQVIDRVLREGAP